MFLLLNTQIEYIQCVGHLFSFQDGNQGRCPLFTNGIQYPVEDQHSMYFNNLQLDYSIT